jgi:hypothetical protein
MRERMVVCGGLQAPRGAPTDTLKLDVNASAGSPRKVNLHLGDLSRPMADNIPDVLTDMLEIAAYAYCADQFTKRGTELMTNMGADWRRKFRFRIPVRCPDVWDKDSVREALVETLGFLSKMSSASIFVRQPRRQGCSRTWGSAILPRRQFHRTR